MVDYDFLLVQYVGLCCQMVVGLYVGSQYYFGGVEYVFVCQLYVIGVDGGDVVFQYVVNVVCFKLLFEFIGGKSVGQWCY